MKEKNCKNSYNSNNNNNNNNNENSESSENGDSSDDSHSSHSCHNRENCKNCKNRSINNNPEKSIEAVNAYKPDYGDIKSDVQGSYTGVPEITEQPVQDADDL